VLNLGAGLDTRPYRMTDLPASLRWVEVDMMGLLEEKTELLAGDTPVCQLERIALDLTDYDKRGKLFDRLNGESRGGVLVITEGLLMYLLEPEVIRLTQELAAQPRFRFWTMDLVAPRTQWFINTLYANVLKRVNAHVHFARPEGADFFVPYGWKPRRVRSMMHAAARAKRVGLLMRLFTLGREPVQPGKRFWYGMCLLERP
jgi:O-methyltransferase involved in polyketide biosynthesis